MVASFSYDTLTTPTSAAFDYDATVDTGRRRSPVVRTKHEDQHADARRRRILTATTRDLNRNFAIAAWAIRKHLDYVSTFSFSARTEDRGFNDALEAFVEEKFAKQNFDVANRHSFQTAIRLTEACRVKDGDVLWLKLANGPFRGRVQAIEGDRVAMPANDMRRDSDPDSWVNGVRVSAYGAPLAYAICDRTRGAMALSKVVPARNVIAHGFFDRFDQVRGVSPIAAGLNWFRDTYEGFEYALAKLKVGQLFGLKITREGDGNPFGQEIAATVDADGDDVADSGYEVSLNKGGVFSLDLAPGDDADILESRTPSTETVAFLQMMIGVALKSLDIPLSFYDEAHTNFYGSRGGLVQYLQSCKSKRRALRDFQDAWCRWRLGVAVADGELTLPRGKSFDWLRWEFVPDGVPWWDPVKEARGAAMSVAAGFSSPQRVCQENGTDFETNIRQIAEAREFARDLGVDLVYADSSAFAPQVTTEDSQVES